MTIEFPDVAVLCGGMGTRIRNTLGALPKALAPIGGLPFLEILVRELAAAGLQRIVLCAGVGADQIRSHFEHGHWAARIIFSVETSPLGTGGALALARSQLRTDPVLVMNGDSRVDGFDWSAFTSGFDPVLAAGRVAMVRADGRVDSGRVRIDGAGRIVTFAEKQPLDGAAYQNAGIYLITRRLLDRIPARESSMERDLLPAWVQDGLEAFVAPGALIDIGTPERLAQAQADANVRRQRT